MMKFMICFLPENSCLFNDFSFFFDFDFLNVFNELSYVFLKLVFFLMKVYAF